MKRRVGGAVLHQVLLGLSLTMGGLGISSPCAAQESAIAEAKARAKAAPFDTDASLAYGRALLRAGRENDALTELRRGVAVAGKKSDAVAHLQWEIARAHIGRRDFRAAIGACRTIATMPSEIPESRACTAEAHLLWRRGSEALIETDALAADAAAGKSIPRDVQYAAKVAEARARELASDDRAAEAAYREALAIEPKGVEASWRLGALLERRGDDGKPALRAAVAADPSDPDAQFALGVALTPGSVDGIAALERAVRERPSFIEATRALADGYIAAKRLPDARRIVESLLRTAPNDVGSHVAAGHVALAEGRVDDAIKEGEAANKLMPNVAAAKLLVADGWAKKGEIDLALEAYQAAFGLDHSDPTPLVNAARACIAAGRVTSAKAFASRATQDFAKHAPAWVVLGDALAADRDKPGAKRAFETAKKLPSADVAAIDRRLADLK